MEDSWHAQLWLGWQSIFALFYLAGTNAYDIFADVEWYSEGYSAVLFNSSNIVVIKDNIMYVTELTVSFETNFSKIRDYKIDIRTCQME